MKRLLLLPALLITSVAFGADDLSNIQARGTLLFSDDFNRTESEPAKEEVGNGWTTNSASRAQGVKQVSLINNAMSVTKASVADHGVSVAHAAEFQDGAIAMRLKLEVGDNFAIDFADMQCKSVHAGHLFKAGFAVSGVRVTDTKMGEMDNAVRERRMAGTKTPEDVALLKTKTRVFPQPLAAVQWHDVLVVVEGDAIRVNLDSKALGELKSEGFAHPTKRLIRLAVEKSALVDDVHVWKLK